MNLTILAWDKKSIIVNPSYIRMTLGPDVDFDTDIDTEPVWDVIDGEGHVIIERLTHDEAVRFVLAIYNRVHLGGIDATYIIEQVRRHMDNS